MSLLTAIPLVARYVEIRRARAQIAAELETYSDRELVDLGISRVDISRIAQQAVG